MKYISICDLPAPPKDKYGWPWTEDSQDESWAEHPHMPSIALVTPTLNQGGFIEETIRSVLLQGYSKLEYWIIDGESTDSTPSIIDKYRSFVDGYIREADEGQSDAINKGIFKTSTELVGWINSDDLLFPNAIRTLAKQYAEKKEVTLIYGGGAKINLHGKVQKLIGLRPHDKKNLRRRLTFLQPSMLFKREAFIATGGLDISLHYVMDWDLALKLAKLGPVQAIPDPIAKLRVYPDSKTGQKLWAPAEEVAKVALRHNGIFDINYLSYVVRKIIGRPKVPFFLKVVRPLVDQIFEVLGRKRGYLITRWPD